MEKRHQAIGVFDSGMGGVSVLQTLLKVLPNEHYIYYGDCAFAPYGIKEKQQIKERSFHIVEHFISLGVKAIVIACNTATSACVNDLREKYPDLIIVGMEPALKPAVDGKPHQNVLVMATPFTLKEKKFAALMSRYDHDHTIYKLPCERLVELIETQHFKNPELSLKVLSEYLSPYMDKEINSIVLGCTHFVFFKKQIQQIIDRDIDIIDGNMGTVRHLKNCLEEANLLSDQKNGEVLFETSGDASLKDLFDQLLQYK